MLNYLGDFLGESICRETFLVGWSTKMKTMQVFFLFKAAEKSCMMIYLHSFAILDIARPAM